MLGKVYQELAMRTCANRKHRKAMLNHGVFGLAAEAGEVASIMQKTYQGHVFDKDHMVKELGDCLWMIAEIADALDISMDDVMSINIEKLKKRYPDGFNSEQSINRKEGDI